MFFCFIFSAIFILWKENFPLTACIFSYAYLPNIRAEWPDDHFEFEIFLSAIYSKFAVEW